MISPATELLVSKVADLLQQSGIPFRLVPQGGHLFIEVLARTRGEVLLLALLDAEAAVRKIRQVMCRDGEETA